LTSIISLFLIKEHFNWYFLQTRIYTIPKPCSQTEQKLPEEIFFKYFFSIHSYKKEDAHIYTGKKSNLYRYRNQSKKKPNRKLQRIFFIFTFSHSGQ